MTDTLAKDVNGWNNRDFHGTLDVPTIKDWQAISQQMRWIEQRYPEFMATLKDDRCHQCAYPWFEGENCIYPECVGTLGEQDGYPICICSHRYDRHNHNVLHCWECSDCRGYVPVGFGDTLEPWEQRFAGY